MEGVVGKNCDRCPVNWVLVVNDNRAIRPKWKEPFDYEEGCFPCSTCVSDLMGTANQLSDSLAPVLEVFGGVNSSYLVRTYSSHIFTNPDFSICNCFFEEKKSRKKITVILGQYAVSEVQFCITERPQLFEFEVANF